VGQAFDAVRKRRYEAAARFLDQIDRAEPPDAVLEASISHCRGTLLHHQGETVLALQHLHGSLEQVIASCVTADVSGCEHSTHQPFPRSTSCRYLRSECWLSVSWP
jgi:hypothetical protein